MLLQVVRWRKLSSSDTPSVDAQWGGGETTKSKKSVFGRSSPPLPGANASVRSMESTLCFVFVVTLIFVFKLVAGGLAWLAVRVLRQWRDGQLRLLKCLLVHCILEFGQRPGT